MKLSDDMLFGHPVLSHLTDDYVGGVFECGFDADISEHELTLSATISLNCPDLIQLIEDGSAGCGYYLICPRTYHNRLVEMLPGKSRHPFAADQFFGTVVVRPVVWSKEARTGWSSGFLHPEYGGEVDFPASALLAVGEEFRFSVDRARLKPFETIFALAADDQIEPGRIAVDPDEARITIHAHPQTKASIEEIRNDKHGKIVLLNAVYLPAVMEVLSQMRGGGAGYEHKAWFRIFEAKCASLGIDPSDSAPLQDAQRLLNIPFARIDEEKERMFD